MTKKDIALSFSHGKFEKIYEFIAENAVWNVVEKNTFTGKNAIITNCEQVANYFKSITAKFETLNIIEEHHQVMISGTAEFLNEGNRLSFISAVDIYEFNKECQILKITSYCIEKL